MTSSFENRYSWMDRLLHRIAFATGTAQIALADIEDKLFESQLGFDVRKPVFVTALPRAGTTLLLELCFELEEFTSHCYRDMPFVLNPMLWNHFAAGFRKTDQLRERAHGDGVLVNTSSPESFEEIIWKAFWRSHYKKDRISPWEDEGNPEFFDFFRNHIRKIIASRGEGASKPRRYVSKNNLNIARVNLIVQNFDDAVVVVPYRQPLQHAASLLRQHLNFLKIHREDLFARDYMAAIGHFDFGENLRPIDFGGWCSIGEHHDATKLSFWITYWVATYEHLLGVRKANDRVFLLSYERFCESPSQGLEHFADILALGDRSALLASAQRIRPAKLHPFKAEIVPPDLLARAEAVHGELLAASAW